VCPGFVSAAQVARSRPPKPRPLSQGQQLAPFGRHGDS